MQPVLARKNPAVLLVLGLFVALALGAFACGSSTSNATTSTVPTRTSEATASTVTSVASTTTAPPASDDGAQALTVSAASSLKAAFTEIGKAFDAANNSKTTFNFDASGTLQKQIEGGAPVDVFASAAPKQVNALVDKKLADASTVKIFAGNEIVLVVPANSTLGLTSFNDLTKAEVKKITYGDPKVAPHGVAAEEILNKIGLFNDVKPKVIYAGNVAQALQYVSSGEVDAGIMFKTEALSAGDKVKIVATADQSWYTTIAYPIVLVSDSKSKTLGQAFIDYVAGSDGQATLKKYGFLPAPAQ
jgi:molybdate transport system substrate-binding protein